MTVELVPYKREHIIPLLEQEANIPNKKTFLSDSAKVLEEHCYSVLINGIVACCGGVLKIWEGRGCVWIVFNTDFKKNFVPIFRAIKRYLNDQLKIFRRIEVSVPLGLSVARRRIELLGFQLECEKAPMYLPTGEDCALYVLLRSDQWPQQ